MSLMVKLRRGEGPFWSRLKALALAVLRFHIPAGGFLRPLFRCLYAVHVSLRAVFSFLARFFWYEPIFRSQCDRVGRNFLLCEMPFIVGAGRIGIGDGVVFGGTVVFMFGNRGPRSPEVTIGDRTFLGHCVNLTLSDSIRIGDHCLIASGVQISDFDGHPVDAARRRANEATPPEGIRPVVIGDDVWIGSNALILKGVSIGDRSVVGAGAVVTRDVPPDVVVAGNPARIVKHLAPRHDADTVSIPLAAGEDA
jgi:acetyltransferase-like isoleucine patch superfamily enzyme